jgi:hypothetical protein
MAAVEANTAAGDILAGVILTGTSSYTSEKIR